MLVMTTQQTSTETPVHYSGTAQANPPGAALEAVLTGEEVAL